MRFLLILIFVILNYSLIAQPAPDFTVTDANGIERSLYADHLDQGQTVLIKLFFIGCPPCAVYHDPLEQLYQDWGAGAYDVEFIQLSVRINDLNSEVAQYHEDENLSFIGVGGDGGSVDASEVYRDGTYGPYWGTPTFVVIAPDGTVNYGILEQGVNNTIEALNEAIIETGAQGDGSMAEDTLSVTISLKDLHDEPMSNVDVYLKSNTNPGDNYLLGASENGFFSFSYPNDQVPTIEEPVLYFDYQVGIAEEGVSTTDLVLSQRHALGIMPFNNDFLQIAADVNSSNSISASDLVAFRRVILGLVLDFPNNTPVWRFIDETCNFDSDPFGVNCREIPLSENTDEVQLIFMKGVKTGDVNLSY